MRYPEKVLQKPDQPLTDAREAGPQYLDPDSFYGPGVAPVVVDVPEYKGAHVQVRSFLQSATCAADFPAAATGHADKLIGDSVTVPAGAFYTIYDLASVVAITEQQLTHLANLSRTALDAMPGMSADALKAGGYGFSTAQAEYVHTALSAITTRLNDQADAFAILSLRCHWESPATTAFCDAEHDYAHNASSTIPAGAFTSVSEYEGLEEQALAAATAALVCFFGNAEQTATCSPAQQGEPSSTTVEADTVASLISKEDANETAQNMAQAQLDCFFTNERQTIRAGENVLKDYNLAEQACLTLTISDLNASEHPTACVGLPETWPVFGTATRARGLIVHMDAGLVRSYVGQDDANELALSLMAGFLDSSWMNHEQVSSPCPWYDEDGNVREVRTCDETRGACALLTAVPPGLSEDCDAAAVVPSAACIPTWTLEEQCYAVTTLQAPEGSYYIDGVLLENTTPTNDAPALSSPTTTVRKLIARPESGSSESLTIPRGAIKSYTSQADADKQARLKADGQTECLYANLEIAAKCIPSGVEKGYNIITGLDSAGEELYPPIEDWPISATVGLPARTIIGPDFASVRAQAIVLGDRTVQDIRAEALDLPVCTYGNSAMMFSCVRRMTAGGLVHGVYDLDGNKLKPDGSIDNNAPTIPPDVYTGFGACYPAVDGDKKTADVFEVAKNVFVVKGHEVPAGLEPQVYVNSMARNLGYSMLYCPRT